MKRPLHLLLFGMAPAQYCRRGLTMFALTYLGAFLFAGLLAFPVYQWFQWLGGDAPEDSFRSWLAAQSLPRIADRLRLAATAAGTVWLIGYARLWGRFGFSAFRASSLFIKCALLGVAMLSLPVALQLLNGSALPRPNVDWSRLVVILAAAIATAGIVSFLEESIFRGMLLRLFTTAFSGWIAITLSAAVFAAVHFKGVKWMTPADPSWLEAWRIVGAGLLAPVLTFDWLTFTNLLLAGLILNLLFWRSGNLVPCFGLHAGWIFAQRVSLGLLQSADGTAPGWLGTPRVIDGFIALFLLATTALWLVRDQLAVHAPALDPVKPV